MTAERIRVMEVANLWGIGGTELAFQLRLLNLPREHFDLLAVGFEGGGPRLDVVARVGIRTATCGLSLAAAEKLVADFRPHVLHYLRVSSLNALIVALQAAARKYGVAVQIESNVFGRAARDPGLAPPDLVAHMTHASMWKCARELGVSMEELYRRGHRTVYNPIPTEQFARNALSADERLAVRRELGFRPDDLVACRIARADLRKWSQRLELALPALFRRVPSLRFLFMAAPSAKCARLTRRFGDRVVFLPETADPVRLAHVYQASDLMVHSSAIGESFGITLAEAMYWRLPVVVDSTPAVDNGQIEVIDHETTGLVVASGRGFVEATARLADDAELRARLGEAGHAKVMRCYAERVIADQWIGHYLDALDRAGTVPGIAQLREQLRPAVPAEAARELTYPSEYEARLRQVMGPRPSLGERVRQRAHAALDTLAFVRQVGGRRVWMVLRDRLSSRRLLRRN
jgi:glycosyltransferase involved in cell wall biosynthesis